MEESGINITTALLIEECQKLKKLIYLSFRKDGSVYIIFPRKKGYVVESIENIDNNIQGIKDIVLENNCGTYYNPKISFHPGKSSLHVSSLDGTRIKLDSAVLNLAEDAHFCYSIGSIVFPMNYTLFDDYTKDEYYRPLILHKVADSDTRLCIELFLHPKNTYIELMDIPNIQIRKNPFGFDFRNDLCKNYCFLLGSEVRAQDKGEDPGLVFVLQDNEKVYISKLKPM